MDRDLAEKLLVAQVLTLAAAMKEEKRQHGVSSTSDFVYDAIRLIRRKQADIIHELLAPPETGG